ncbi:MAG TPA: hypothetical protein VIO38_17070 [Rariglobus sp.]
MSDVTPPSFPASSHPTKRRWKVVGWSAGLVLLDFLSGPQYAFSVFFVLPVIWAAWYVGLAFSCWLGVGFCVLRFGCHWWWGFPFDFSPAVINNVLRGATFLLVAFLTERLAWQFRQMRQRMQRLEARLPVCPSCGLVCRKDGRWAPLDDNSELAADRPLKTLCPDCEQKQYGVLMQ